MRIYMYVSKQKSREIFKIGPSLATCACQAHTRIRFLFDFCYSLVQPTGTCTGATDSAVDEYSMRDSYSVVYKTCSRDFRRFFLSSALLQLTSFPEASMCKDCPQKI